jgi:hypothetical protein
MPVATYVFVEVAVVEEHSVRQRRRIDDKNRTPTTVCGCPKVRTVTPLTVADTKQHRCREEIHPTSAKGPGCTSRKNAAGEKYISISEIVQWCRRNAATRKKQCAAVSIAESDFACHEHTAIEKCNR